MMNLILLQSAPPQSLIMTMAPMLLVVAIFWFVVLAPERKRRRELQSSIDTLKKGDKIITHGGLHGEVASVEEGILLLKIADGVKVRVAKHGVAGLADSPGTAK